MHCSYRLKFFTAKDHLWDGNSHNYSLFGFVPLEALEGLSTQRVWHDASRRGDRVQSARRSRAIHYKINDDVCGFHPVLYATQTLRMSPLKSCYWLVSELDTIAIERHHMHVG